MAEIHVIANALADPMRVAILELLVRGRQEAACSPSNPDLPGAVCACDVRTAMGGLAPSKLAYHLKLLRGAGLVDERRRGKWVYYTIRESTLEEFSRALTRWLHRG